VQGADPRRQRLCGVEQQRRAGLRREHPEPLDVADAHEGVRADDRPRAVGRARAGVGGQAPAAGVDVDEARLEAVPQQRVQRGRERERRHEHRRAGLEAERADGEREPDVAARGRAHVPQPGVGAAVLLEAHGHRPEVRQLPALPHGRERVGVVIERGQARPRDAQRPGGEVAVAQHRRSIDRGL
jgi:hypothetical protein